MRPALVTTGRISCSKNRDGEAVHRHRDLENQKGMWEKLFTGEIDCLVSIIYHALLEMKAGNIMESMVVLPACKTVWT